MPFRLLVALCLAIAILVSRSGVGAYPLGLREDDGEAERRQKAAWQAPRHRPRAPTHRVDAA